MAGTLGKSKGGGMIVGINVTPMVDVVLVLLVIMMVSATYIVSQSLKVDLPKAASGTDSVASIATITLGKGNKLYFNQVPIEERALVKELTALIDKNAEVNVIVSADKYVPHGQVVHAIDLAKGVGVTHFAINVEPVM
jgi:biopolymer transport protein ExbD